MPVAVAMRFPVGRFHATPWGHHVNEGLPEWPPSAWRFLRALVASWKRKLSDEALLTDLLPGILRKLTAPPFFELPPATLGHLRHFMPLRFPDLGERTKVFDAFTVLDPRQPVKWLWPDVALTADERSVLSRLLMQLGYFGRAESWCVAELLAEGTPVSPNSAPAEASARVEGGEVVRVLVADPGTWDQWGFGASTRRPAPPWNLLAETVDLFGERWSDPPGSRWMTYTRPADCFAPKPALFLRESAMPTLRPTVARFMLDAPVLPLVTETLPLAEAARSALMGRFQRRLHLQKYGTPERPYRERFYSRVLSGKDAAGRPLLTHGHAYYLPTAESDGGRLDHLTVYAEEGFGPDEVVALDSFRLLRFGEGEPLRLMLAGLGRPEDFRCALFGPARLWRSATPFVVTRHVKTRGRKKDPPECRGLQGRPAFAERVLGEEVERWRRRRPGLAEAEEIRYTLLWDQPLGGGVTFRPLEFRRGRRKPGDDGLRRATAACRLEFARPVAGPICLGHAAHFGLGLFLPEP